MWSYQLLDNASKCILSQKDGFSSKEDATLQGNMDAKLENIKNFHVIAIQTNQS